MLVPEVEQAVTVLDAVAVTELAEECVRVCVCVCV